MNEEQLLRTFRSRRCSSASPAVRLPDLLQCSSHIHLRTIIKAGDLLPPHETSRTSPLTLRQRYASRIWLLSAFLLAKYLHWFVRRNDMSLPPSSEATLPPSVPSVDSDGLAAHLSSTKLAVEGQESAEGFPTRLQSALSVLEKENGELMASPITLRRLLNLGDRFAGDSDRGISGCECRNRTP